jgi:hypothetical protein
LGVADVAVQRSEVGLCVEARPVHARSLVELAAEVMSEPEVVGHIEAGRGDGNRLLQVGDRPVEPPD